jgi:hypothetical protein
VNGTLRAVHAEDERARGTVVTRHPTGQQAHGPKVQFHLPALQELSAPPAGHVKSTGTERRQTTT